MRRPAAGVAACAPASGRAVRPRCRCRLRVAAGVVRSVPGWDPLPRLVPGQVAAARASAAERHRAAPRPSSSAVAADRPHAGGGAAASRRSSRVAGGRLATSSLPGRAVAAGGLAGCRWCSHSAREVRTALRSAPDGPAVLAAASARSGGGQGSPRSIASSPGVLIGGRSDGRRGPNSSKVVILGRFSTSAKMTSRSLRSSVSFSSSAEASESRMSR